MTATVLTDQLAAAAHAYGRWAVPLLPASKRPAVHDWPNWTATRQTVDDYWRRTPTANVGIRTGAGLVVVDVDPRSGGDDVLADLEHEHGPLPDTIEVETGGQGRHLYFRGPGTFPSFDLGAGLEVKADGRQVVAPPSVHPDTGALYGWRDGHAPGEIERADLPAWIAAERRQTAQAGADPGTWRAMVRDGIPAGSRNTTLASLVGYLLARNLDAHVVEEIALLMARHRCRPPLSDREARQIVESIADRELRKRTGRT